MSYLQVVSDVVKAVAPLVPEIGSAFARVVEMIVQDLDGGERLIRLDQTERTGRASGRSAYSAGRLAGLPEAISRTLEHVVPAGAPERAELVAAATRAVMAEVLVRWPRE